MTTCKVNWWRRNLRIKCFIIGYMNLFACIVDMTVHIVIVAIASNGFQCDMDEESLASIDWPWLEPFLMLINLGNHGFYPFPMVMRHRRSVLVDYMPLTPRPRCYPGMFHVYLIDILNFLINFIWLKFVKAYVVAVHKKDPEPMRMFLGLSIVKLVLQVFYFSYQPEFMSVSSIDTYWLNKLLDILVACIFVLIIHDYIKELKQEKTETVEQPPSYVECLMNAPPNQSPELVKEKRETEVAIPVEKKTELPVERV